MVREVSNRTASGMAALGIVLALGAAGSAWTGAMVGGGWAVPLAAVALALTAAAGACIGTAIRAVRGTGGA